MKLIFVLIYYSLSAELKNDSRDEMKDQDGLEF